MRIAIIGTGYVGLVTGTCLASLGHKVTCVDKQEARVDMLNAGKAPFYEPGLSELVTKLVGDGSLKASTDLASAVKNADVSIIAVGTPDKDGKIDLSQVAAAAGDIGKALREHPGYHVVTVKSTVVPGTTDTVVRQAVEAASGKKAGVDFGLCMNPETLREGAAIEDFMTADRILIGQFDDRSGQVLLEVYEKFDCPKLILTLRNAEFVKYASNLLLATLISYSNEIAAMCEAVPDTDVDVVMDGVHLDRRFSPVVDGKRISPGMLTYLRAGSGYGGSCFPKDVNALRNFAGEIGIPSPILDAVVSVNKARPAYVVKLADQISGGVAGKTVAVLGIAFKPGTDDLRDSPAMALIQALLASGAKVKAYDPMCNEGAEKILGDRIVYSSSAEDAVKGADMVALGTAWPEFLALDWKAAAASMKSPILVDARNAFRGKPKPEGINYYSVGRNYA